MKRDEHVARYSGSMLFQIPNAAVVILPEYFRIPSFLFFTVFLFGFFLLERKACAYKVYKAETCPMHYSRYTQPVDLLNLSSYHT